MYSPAASSTTAPATASRAAGTLSRTDAPTSPIPPPAAAALPANTIGSSRCASCHVGTAVFENSTAVYVPSAGPITAATAPEASPARRNRPVSSEAAVAAANVANGERIQVPTDSGDVGLNTRSMWWKRDGRCRSWMRNTVPPAAPAAAARRPVRRRVGRSVAPPSAPRPADVDASPPRNRYSGTSGFFHTGALMIGRP